MFKESEAYLGSLSDEISDQISDPEDVIVSESDTQEESEVEDEGEGEDEGEDMYGKQTRKKSIGKAGSSSRSSRTKKTQPTEKGKGRAHKPSTTPTARKTVPSPKVIPPAPTVPKRRAGGVRFSGLGTSISSSSSSSAKTMSALSPPSAPARSISRSNGNSRVVVEPGTKSHGKLTYWSFFFFCCSVSHDSEDQWAEKYAPTNIRDVAVHPGKISSVREWLKTYTVSRT